MAEPVAPAELLALEVRTLFVLDAGERLVALNEPAGGAPPLVFVGRAAGATAIHVAATAPAELRAEVAAIVAGWPPFDPEAPKRAPGEALLAALRRHGAAGRLHQGPAFTFPRPLYASLGALQIYPGNAGLLHPELATLGPEIPQRRPTFAVLRDRQVVSACYSARQTAEAAEAGVETASTFRGQGCATLAVTAWAAAIRESGRIPFYSTSWANAASLAVARKLELELFAEHLTVD